MSPAPKNKRGGARKGSGRKPRESVAAAPPEQIDARGVRGHLRAGELIAALNSLPEKEGDSIEIAGWRRFWDSTNTAIAFDCRRYLYDKADGKAHQTINHVHDKPIDMNLKLSLGEGMRLAMEKAEKRVSSRN